MRTASKFLAAALSLSIGFSAATAQADGIWFAERSTKLAFIYGIGPADRDSVKRLPLIKEVGAYDANWKPLPTKLQADGPLLVLNTEGQATIVTGVMDNNNWTKNAAGKWQRKGKDEVPDAVDSMKAMKYTVTIQGPLTSEIPPLANQVLQIVPVGKVIPDTYGKPIKLRVLFQGKPIAGVPVLADLVNAANAEPVTSDKDGIVTIPVRNQGLNVISALYMGPTDDPKKVDHIQHRATLAFTLAYHSE